VILTFSEREFINLLKECDVAWFISDSAFHEVSPEEFADAVISFHLSGKGLAIWADNEPYIQHANAVLKTHFDMEVGGDTPGASVLSVGDDGKKKGTFGRHLLSSGISQLFEGITICFPKHVGKLEVLATSSNGNPVILYLDHEPRGPLPPNVGRVLLDCAFTKLYCNWDTAGTARYVANISVWLLGLDTRATIGAPLKGTIPHDILQQKKEKEEQDKAK